MIYPSIPRPLSPESLATTGLFTSSVVLSVHSFLSNYSAISKEASFAPFFIKRALNKHYVPGSVLCTGHTTKDQNFKVAVIMKLTSGPSSPQAQLGPK